MCIADIDVGSPTKTSTTRAVAAATVFIGFIKCVPPTFCRYGKAVKFGRKATCSIFQITVPVIEIVAALPGLAGREIVVAALECSEDTVVEAVIMGIAASSEIEQVGHKVEAL